jgi:ADP-ribose pyrophosphatase
MDNKKVEIESAETVFKEHPFEVTKAVLRFECHDGAMSETVKRLCLERGDSVAALLYNRDTGRLLLIEQFRYPTYRHGDGWLAEVVAGMIDKGETPEEALYREIEEESGFRIKESEHIHTFYVSPGGTSERIFLYYVEVGDTDRTGPGGGLASEAEDIKALTYTPAEAFALLDRGEVTDAKTLIALMWLRHRPS